MREREEGEGILACALYIYILMSLSSLISLVYLFSSTIDLLVLFRSSLFSRDREGMRREREKDMICKGRETEKERARRAVQRKNDEGTKRERKKVVRPKMRQGREREKRVKGERDAGAEDVWILCCDVGRES